MFDPLPVQVLPVTRLLSDIIHHCAAGIFLSSCTYPMMSFTCITDRNWIRRSRPMNYDFHPQWSKEQIIQQVMNSNVFPCVPMCLPLLFSVCCPFLAPEIVASTVCTSVHCAMICQCCISDPIIAPAWLQHMAWRGLLHRVGTNIQYCII